MPARLGVVLVHFHTPELAERALGAVSGDAAAAGLDVRLVVVDNGSTLEGRERLARLERSHGARVVDAGENLGYAAGINLGVETLGGPGLGEVDVLVVMNPDVEVEPGCLGDLVRALEDGAGVAGPRFFWDRRGGFMLPPTEKRSRRHSLRRLLATRRLFGYDGAARRAWRRHARRHWLAEEPIASHELSGALLAFGVDAWRRVGPFDAGYRLYFEETDWLERARRLGVEARYVPSAEAVHGYAQSTPAEPRAAAWFAESHSRFRRRHYGRLFTAALESCAGLLPSPAPWPEAPSTPPSDAGEARWLEVSASPLGFPAAGQPVRGLGDSPDELLPAGADPGVYFLRAIGDDERELWTCRVAR